MKRFLAALLAGLMLLAMMPFAAAEGDFTINGVTFTRVDEYEFSLNGTPTGYVNYDLVNSPDALPAKFPVGPTHWVRFFADDPAITPRISYFTASGQIVELDLIVTPYGTYFTVPFEARGLLIRIHVGMPERAWTYQDAHCGIGFFKGSREGFEGIFPW